MTAASSDELMSGILSGSGKASRELDDLMRPSSGFDESQSSLLPAPQECYTPWREKSQNTASHVNLSGIREALRINSHGIVGRVSMGRRAIAASPATKHAHLC